MLPQGSGGQRCGTTAATATLSRKYSSAIRHSGIRGNLGERDDRWEVPEGRGRRTGPGPWAGLGEGQAWVDVFSHIRLKHISECFFSPLVTAPWDSGWCWTSDVEWQGQEFSPLPKALLSFGIKKKGLVTLKILSWLRLSEEVQIAKFNLQRQGKHREKKFLRATIFTFREISKNQQHFVTFRSCYSDGGNFPGRRRGSPC